MRNAAEEILDRGCKLLQSFLSKHGFAFLPLATGPSSGGPFASAEFKRGDRRLELHFRDSLGMVTYHLGPRSVTHEEYMLSVLGNPYASRYPGFSDDPLDAFRGLSEDLMEHCNEFLEGTDEAFLSRIEDARARWANRPKLPD